MSSNPKIATIRPDAGFWRLWDPAPYAGFSYLLDNPARSLCERDGFARIACDPRDPNGNLTVYEALAGVVDRLQAELRRYRLLPIDPATYHITYWDGINQSNLGKLTLSATREYTDFLRGLPLSIAGPLPSSFPPHTLSLPAPWSITLRFAGLTIWPSAPALVALFEPNEESLASMALLQQYRRELDQEFATVGKPASKNWTPHVTLGYFETAADAEAALPMTSAWTERFIAQTGNAHITFSSASAYAFADMHTFWLCRLPAVVVRQKIVEAARGGVGDLGSTGAQKIALPYHIPRTEYLARTHWTALAPNGKKHHLISPTLEVAVFDQRAKQDRHRHAQATEIYRVIDGAMAIRVGGGTEHLLSAGDTIVVPPNVDHEVQRKGRFLAQVVMANAGGLEDKHVCEQSARTDDGAPPVLIVPLHALDARVGALAESGAQKILVVGEAWANEVAPPPNVMWTQVDRSGKRPVATTSNLGMAVFDERARQDRHFHKLATEIYAVLRGTMTIEIAGTEYDLATGDTVIVTPWAVHEVRPRTSFLAQVLTINSTGQSDKYVVDR